MKGFSYRVIIPVILFLASIVLVGSGSLTAQVIAGDCCVGADCTQDIICKDASNSASTFSEISLTMFIGIIMFLSSITVYFVFNHKIV